MRIAYSNPEWRPPGRPSTFHRRQILPSYAGVTCIALVVHDERPKALLVSDSGDRTKAVWIPRAMVSIEEPRALCFIVATMSKRFAEMKALFPRFIDPKQFPEGAREALFDAVVHAARKRNLYRGHRAGAGRRITQNDFC